MTINISITRTPIYGYGIMKPVWREFGTPPLFAPPATIPLQETPFGDEKGTPYRLLVEHKNHIQSISPASGFQWMMKPFNMVINDEYSYWENPLCQLIGCGGNYFAYDKETKTHVRLVSYNWLDTTYLDPKIHNWLHYPWKIWKAVAITKEGVVRNVGASLDAYWKLISKRELWVHRDFVELFQVGLNYRFYGVDVYNGKTPLLTIQNGQRVFHTNWRIQTANVVPPQGWKM